MKAISVFKKAAIPALVLLLILAMTVSIIPMVSADDASQPKVASNTLAISGDITLVTYFYKSDFADAEYVTVTVPTQGGGNKTIKTLVADLEVSRDRYAVKAPLAAAQLTDTVIITWYNKGGKAIATYERCAKTNYIDKVLAAAAPGNAYESLVAPLKSLLNYGAMAQTMFNHNTESMANADLSADYNPTYGMSADNFYDAVETIITDNSEGTIRFTGTEVFLQSSMRLRVYFQAPEGANVKITDGIKTIESARVYKDKDTGYYYVNINNIASFNLDKQFYVTVYCGDKSATASVSVLGYAKTQASVYKAHVSNTFKALYQYYTQTKVYTDNEYKPGPKDQDGKVICTHTRTYIDGNDIVCPDCHESLDKPTLSFKAKTIELIKGKEQEVQFTINIAGKNTLQAIIVTPTPMMTDGVTPAGGVTLTYKKGSLHVVNAESGLDGEVGLNIVLDAETAMDGCEVVTLTYNVTASESGTYKIGLKTRDAIDANGNAVDGVIASNAEIVVKKPECEEHNFGYEVFANNHRAFCDTCKRVFDIENHAYAAEKKYSSTKLVVNSEICECGKESENNVKNTYTLGFSVAKDENTKEDVKTPNKKPLFLLTPKDLSEIGGNNLGEKVLSEDGDYVTFHNSTKLLDEMKDGKPTGNKILKEGYFSIISKDQGETGRYIAIKYRTTYNKPHEWFVGANNGKTSIQGNENFYTPESGVFVPNGEWQVMILDLAALKPDHYKADSDGTYSADYIRFDIFNTPSAEDQTFDIAYIAMSDDIMSLASFADNDVYRFSATRSGTDAVGTYMGSTKTLNPVFDAYWIRYAVHTGGSTLGFGTDADNGNLPYTSITRTGNKGDCYVTLVSNTTYPAYTATSENKYLVVLYKGSEHQSTSLEGWASSNKSGANNTGEKFLNGGPLFSKDSYWHFGIYSMANAYQGSDVDWLNGEGVAYKTNEAKDGIKDADGNYFDPTLGLSMLRFDYFNNTTEFEGERICDLAFFGVFDTEEQAYKYLAENYLEYLTSCQHDATSDYKSDCQKYCEFCGEAVGEKSHVYPTVWSVVEGRGEDGKLYESRTCTRCGEHTEKREMFFHSNLDAIRVNGKVTMPNSENTAQSTYAKRGAKATGRYDAAEYFNDGNGNNYTVTNSLSLTGWVAVNGGVKGIVFKINNGAWQATEGTIAADNGGIKKLIVDNLKDLDPESTVSACNFQGSAVAVPAAALEAHVGETVIITFAYVPKANPGTDEDPNAIIFAEIYNMYIACDHLENTNTEYAFDATNPQKFSVVCSACGEKVYKEADVTDKGLLFFGPEYLTEHSGTSLKPTLKTDASGMSYVQVTSTKKSGEETVQIFADATNPIPGEKLGKYIAIVYRNSGANEQIQLVYEGKLGYVQANVKNCPNTPGGTDWKIAIVEVNNFSGTNSKGQAYGYDGTQLTAFRVDYFNNERAVGDTVDVAFIAFFNSTQDAATYFSNYLNAYKGLEYNCTHSATMCTTTWSSADKLYATVCNVCGHTTTDDMLYKTESNSSGNAGSKENYLSVSTGKDADGETYVRYTAVTQPTSDPYFYLFSTGGTVTTGKYMVVKYRMVNGNKNGSVSRLFAGTLASGKVGATGSDYCYAAPSTLYADGEWHYMVISPKEGDNNAFIANADGTYNWRYLRLNVAGWEAYDKSCYLDIAEVAFAPDAEAAEYYAYKNDPAKVAFTVNFDASYNKLNGEKFLAEAAQTSGVCTIDMSAYAALKTPTSLQLGGWVCTPGGVSTYSIRVTSVDGVAVEDPTTVHWYNGTKRDDIYNVVGKAKGYSDLCARGAGMGAGGTIVDLTAYNGSTVNFEIVAKTQFGAEVVVAKIINVAVPAAQ